MRATVQNSALSLAASLPRCLAASLPRCLAASLPRCRARSASSAPAAPDTDKNALTIQGNDTEFLQARRSGRVVDFDAQYWCRGDRTVALLAVYDANSDTYSHRFRLKTVSIGSRIHQVILWDGADAVAIEAGDLPDAGKAMVVYFNSRGAVTQTMDAAAVDAIFFRTTGHERNTL